MTYHPTTICEACSGTGKISFGPGLICDCGDCDGRGNFDADACKICGCRGDLDHICKACEAAEVIVLDCPSSFHADNIEALAKEFAKVINSRDWKSRINPRIDLSSRDPWAELRGLAA